MKYLKPHVEYRLGNMDATAQFKDNSDDLIIQTLAHNEYESVCLNREEQTDLAHVICQQMTLTDLLSLRDEIDKVYRFS